jgi:hypothetical protein
MSSRIAAVIRRHPLVLFLIILASASILYLKSQHGSNSAPSRSFGLSDTVTGFNISDHFARLQHAHWRYPFESYDLEAKAVTSASAATRNLQPEEAYKEQDGLLYLSDQARPGANPANRVEHPILYLIRQAKKDWKKKLDSQSPDLASAVKTYKRKYGRAPPRGFDKW